MRVVWIGGYFPPDQEHFAEVDQRLDHFMVYGATTQLPWLPFTPVAPHGVAHRTFQPSGRVARGHLWWWYRGLSGALEADRPDLVHVVSEPWGLLAQQAVRWCRRRNVPIVVHGCDRIWSHGPWIEQWVRRLAVRRTVPHLAGYAAETRLAISKAGEHGLPARAATATIHTNPRNPALFRPAEGDARRATRKRLGLPEAGLGVGFVGRLTEAKGPLVYLDAVEQLLTEPPVADVSFSIAGDGPLRSEIDRRSPRLSVRYLGQLGYPEEVAEYFRALDVLVVPSYTTAESEEQSPRIIIEGLMSGCFVIGSNSGAIPEMIGSFGLCVPERDGAALARSLSDVIESHSLDVSAFSGRKMAIERYSPAAVAGQLVEFWTKAVGCLSAEAADSGNADR